MRLSPTAPEEGLRLSQKHRLKNSNRTICTGCEQHAPFVETGMRLRQASQQRAAQMDQEISKCESLATEPVFVRSGYLD